MKRKILLIDESLTVQKVVALTLDKQLFSVSYAKSRSEAMRAISDSPPDLVLVAEQVADINPASFPKEVESWVRASHPVPPLILITTQDIAESRGYAAVLRKPFSPQSLQLLVAQHAQPNATASLAAAQQEMKASAEEFEARRLENVFNNAFSDEARLVQETLAPDEATVVAELPLSPLPGVPGLDAPDTPVSRWAEPPSAPAPLWSADGGPARRPIPEPPPVAPRPAPRAPSSPTRLWNEPAATARPAPALPPDPPRAAPLGTVSELSRRLEEEIDTRALDEAVQRALDRIVPPIVERLVQQRLDALLQDRGGMKS